MTQGVWVFAVNVWVAGKLQRSYVEIPYVVGDVEVEESDHECSPDCPHWQKEKTEEPT